MKHCEAHRLVLSSMFKDLTLYRQEMEQAEEQMKPLCVQKNSSQQFLIKQHVRGVAPEIEDRRQKPSQISMFAAGDETEGLRVHDESCGQRLETQQNHPLSKMTKGSAAMLESNAAYYSKWDEGNSSRTFPLTDMRV